MKSFKKLAVLSLCAALPFAVCGCVQTTNVQGEVSYTEWGTNYGIKVNVEVQASSKGDRIRKVTVIESDLVDATEGWNGKEKWDKELDNLLLAYRGEYVADVLAKEVTVNDNGAPVDSSSSNYIDFGEDFIISGATIGSARLLLAVQNALKTL